MRDDVAFESQQFAEQVAQRRDRYAEQNIETWRQAPDMVGRFQQSMAAQQQIGMQRQQHDADMLTSAERLATDQLRRQAAAEELAYARELHTTDMVALQKRRMQAETEFAEMRMKSEAQRFDIHERDLLVDPARMTGILSMGLKVRPGPDGRIEVYEAEANDPDVAMAKKYRAEWMKRGGRSYRASPERAIDVQIKAIQTELDTLKQQEFQPGQNEAGKKAVAARRADLLQKLADLNNRLARGELTPGDVEPQEDADEPETAGSNLLKGLLDALERFDAGGKK